jgi:HK97 family phage portal protein
MSVEQIKALSRISSRRGLNWLDERRISPKAVDDMSGPMSNAVSVRYSAAIQDFDYDMLARIYICNDMAWTCINLVSSTAALAQLKVRTKDGTDYKYLPDHPLQQVLDNPSTDMTQFDLIQAYVTHQLLYGTTYMLLLRQDMTKVCPVCVECQDDSTIADPCLHSLYYYADGPIQQIIPVHPSTIKEKFVKMPNTGETRKVLFYCPYANNKRLEYPVHPSNILTDPMYNSTPSTYGVSPTFLLKRWLDLDTAMTRQVTQFFENGAIPSLIVSLKPGTNFTYEDEPTTLVQKMKQSWMDQFSKGGRSEKSPAFVYGDINVERVQDKIEDTIGKSLYYEIQGRVCATFGVPPALYEMGLRYGSRGTNADQGEKDFYNRTISKILARFRHKVNQLIIPSYNKKGLEVGWDLSELGLASFLADAKDKRILNHWQYGLINRNESRSLLGYEPVSDPALGDDYYRLTVMGDGNNATSNQLEAGQHQGTVADNNLTVPNVPEPTNSTSKH